MGPNFPVLTFVSKMLRYFGFVVFICGLAYALIAGLLEPLLPRHSYAISDAIEFAAGIAICLFGLITIALGESIGVLFAIEKNTRKA